MAAIPATEKPRTSPELLIDRESLEARVRDALSAQGVCVDSIEVEKWSRKSDREATIYLQARVASGDDAEHELFFHGKAFTPGAPELEALQLRSEEMELRAPIAGAPVLDLRDHGVFLWAYPNDPDLPGLAHLEDNATLRNLIRENPSKFGMPDAEPEIDHLDSLRIKYGPSRRAGFLFKVHYDTADASQQQHRFYGKAYFPELGPAAAETLFTIWNSEARRQGRLLIPQPYWYDEATSVLWQEAFAGEPLAKTAKKRADLPELTRTIGSRLAAFHGIDLNLPDSSEYQFQTEELHNKVGAISGMFPEHAQAYLDLEVRLLALQDRFDTALRTPVHGSFKFSHIFPTPGGLLFIDFDNCGLGDPGYDVGRLIAHVYKMQVSGKLDAAVAGKAISAFCEGYNDAAEIPLEQARIDWYTITHLINSQAYKAVKNDAPALLGALADTAGGILDAGPGKVKTHG